MILLDLSLLIFQNIRDTVDANRLIEAMGHSAKRCTNGLQTERNVSEKNEFEGEAAESDGWVRSVWAIWRIDEIKAVE